MASKLEDIEKAALNLSEAERAQLVTRLVASLGEETDAELELAWVEEAERRYQEAVKDPSAVGAVLRTVPGRGARLRCVSACARRAAVKTVDLHRQATAEMIEAARVYAQRREGLGFRFIRVVEEVCDKIGEFPEAGAPLGRKDRKRRVPRFPYDVVYRIREEERSCRSCDRPDWREGRSHETAVSGADRQRRG